VSNNNTPDIETQIDAAVAVVHEEYRPRPRYRHMVLSNGEVVAEPIDD
jgi:hypothetical protein